MLTKMARNTAPFELVRYQLKTWLRPSRQPSLHSIGSKFGTSGYHWVGTIIPSEKGLQEWGPGIPQRSIMRTLPSLSTSAVPCFVRQYAQPSHPGPYTLRTPLRRLASTPPSLATSGGRACTITIPRWISDRAIAGKRVAAQWLGNYMKLP